MTTPLQHSIKEEKSDDKIALFILLFAAIFRFFGAGNFSISADELSALSRISYDSFYDLIYKGVVPDMHPPLVQAFLYYYCKVFGTSEWAIRMPSVLLGSASVYLLYSIAKKFIGSTPALFAMASVSFCQLFFIYSRIARPYSYGLFFCLACIYFWQKIFVSKSNSIYPFIAMGIYMGLAMLTHAMSFFFVGIVGISGLFFIRKEIFLKYLLSGIIAVAMFLPFINVFLFQLNQKGVGGDNGWLAKPDPDFFTDFAKYLFNDTRWYLWAFIVLFIFLIIFANRNKFPIKWKVLSLCWFAIPMLFAYYYSVKINPILQNSILIFSTPFFFVFIFSFFQEIKQAKMKSFLVFGFAVSLFSISVFVQKIYCKQFFGVYKELVELGDSWNKKLGAKNIAHHANVDSKFFIDYYNKQLEKPINYFPIYYLDVNSLKPFEKEVQQASLDKEYFSYCWSNLDNLFENIQLIKVYFPYLVEKRYFNNSEYYLFSRHKQKFGKDELPEKKFQLLASNIQFPFKGNFTPYAKDSSIQLLSAANNFSINYKNIAEKSFYQKSSMLYISASVMKLQEHLDAQLVFDCTRNDSVIEWRSINLNYYGLEPNRWHDVFFVAKWNKNYLPTDLITSYIWSNGSDSLLIKNFKVESREGNKLVYGKYDTW